MMGRRVTLYRGIRAKAEQRDEIVRAHMQGELGPYAGSGSGYSFHRLPENERTRLVQLENLTLEMTRPRDTPATGWIFASGDLLGAEHYAFHHGGRLKALEVPLVIEFEVDLDSLVVDGRDCLYTLSYGQHIPAVRAAILAIYGPACIRVIEPATGRDTREATARVDLACQDQAVVQHHLANREVVAGRYGTLFRSSFMLRPAEAAPTVRRVWTPEALQPRPAPDHVVYDLMRGVFLR
jgi:hypothetical protein